MKIIMLSTDENIFKEGSEVRSRMFEYGKLVEELHIVIKSQKSRLRQGFGGQAKVKSQNIGNVFLYSTNDKFNFLYFFNAYKISKEIIYKLQATSCKLLITCQDPFETGLVGYFLKKKFNISLQIQIHTDFLSPYFWRESLKNKIRVILAKRIIPSADGIRVVSERIKNSLQAISYKLKANVVVLPIFVDIEKIKNAPIKTDLRKKYPGKFIVLMASRLTREKNIGLAVEAMKKLKDADLQIKCESADCGYKENQQSASSAYHPHYQHHSPLLLIVGFGPEESKLKAKSYKLQAQAQASVVFESWSDDLPSYYKTSDLFLLTSNYEGYGMAVIEATAASLPVLMADVGISIGSIVPVGNLEMLTERLDILIGDSLERERVLENQKKILNNMPSKIEYLNLIKQSWSRCLGIEDSRFKSESGENK